MKSRIFVGLILGALGGFIGWLLQENFIHYRAFKDALGVAVSVPLNAVENRTLLICVGGLIGMALGVVDGIIEGNSRRVLQGAITGALGGVVFGSVGMQIGNELYVSILGPGGVNGIGLAGFIRNVVARSVGWAFIGLGIGAGAAAATLSLKRLRNGAIGGFIGGFIGGLIFDSVARMNVFQTALGSTGASDVAGPSRMIGFTVIGALTGLFIGIVEELLKEAWVKVLAGKNEGKDIILSKPLNIIGREERCVVPLYGDMSVGIQHAAIRADGNRHVLIDAGTPAGTLVNGQRVEPNKDHLLRDGDMLQIGHHRVLFRERSTQSKTVGPNKDLVKAASPASSVKMPSHLCAFCGAPKDPTGKCLCSVGSNSSPGMPAPYSARPVYPDAYGINGVPPLPIAPVGQSGQYAQTLAPDVSGFSQGYGAVPGPLVPAVGQLTGLEGVYAGQVFYISNMNMTVGREPGCDLLLSGDTSVSRNHARLSNENGQFVLYDNGSSNGTFVNGLRVSSPVALAPGDLVQFGASKFHFA